MPGTAGAEIWGFDDDVRSAADIAPTIAVETIEGGTMIVATVDGTKIYRADGTSPEIPVTQATAPLERGEG
jgi:hypothetical protein